MNSIIGYLLAAVLVAIGVGVVYDQYSNGERGTTIQAVTAEVTGVIVDAKANFGPYNCNGVTTAAAVSTGVIPKARANVTMSAATNIFNGAITLVDNSTSTPRTCLLTYDGVPAALCPKIVIATEGLVAAVDIGTTRVKEVNGALQIAALGTQCNAATSSTIKWVIGRA